MLLWPFNKYPGTDYETFNWEWLIATVQKLQKTVEEFVAYNKLTWLGVWDASKTYLKWSIVLDPNSNNAYLAIKNVPINVPITNTEYWQMVGDYQTIYTAFGDRINDMESVLRGEQDTILPELPYVTPEMFGAVGDGVTDDTTALTAAMDYSNVKLGHNKVYKISGTIYPDDSEKNAIIIDGDGSTIKPVGSTYAVIYYHENMKITDVTIDLGDAGAYVFGLRSASNNGDGFTAENVFVDHAVTDGIYHDTGSASFVDTRVKRCARNGVAVVAGNVVNFIRGDYGTGNERVAAIDVEPNEGMVINAINMFQCRTPGRIQLIANTGRSDIKSATLDGVELDNTNGHCELYTSRTDKLVIRQLVKINDPSLRIGGSIEVQNGAAYCDDEMESLNMAGSLDNFDNSSYNGGTLTDVTLNGRPGKTITTPQGSYRTIKKVIQVEPNTRYTFGALMVNRATGNKQTGLFVTDNSVDYCCKPDVGEGAKWVNRSFVTAAGTTTVTLYAGSRTSQPSDIDIANVYFVKGTVQEYFNKY